MNDAKKKPGYVTSPLRSLSPEPLSSSSNNNNDDNNNKKYNSNNNTLRSPFGQGEMSSNTEAETCSSFYTLK
ncbi:hypothetical protein PoB_007402300 [Plakobranchus ocellatus]|uniref:Uncharacterized protein n=1 Tax=Plakobranchus ocellatus TaxID=259542 RepID=A0AAV4DT57_9GAST|nr:hypothetical protein PoB_007402300 [Plakobranchus ocellatus]